ncbi:hypothetical protein [Rhizobium rhizogenes]|uniref:hypothetical protein n=1 Tax=Rhizobium rhizogenes TaxID=359 RepID=UPI0004D39080|nr:hypothetical protein [Rhizobium rhizogenes]KEA07519.1 hypothetical protein CN09_11535 [Rhizobium rhizogenes]NTJ22197.1 hypothetical protein [Rhizobium rhizogenes]QUE80916.1 hypothetical protein EML492_03655 [Rhizobium rhizogenes]TQO80977.1 hypothetical protein FFE80_07745 [Rhizobium rhizogenes]TRB51571.1 hypothetical protein EXN69_26630 [Rhizobium rhizogenes]
MSAALKVQVLNEPLLADNETIYADYNYVADGKPVVSDWHQITVREFKMRIGAKEIRRCDLIGRSMMLVFA